MNKLKIPCLVISILLSILTIFQWVTSQNKPHKNYTVEEQYDERLNSLRTLNKFSLYIDSIAKEQMIINFKYEIIDSASYVLLVDSLMKQRFYHGYSHYSLRNNYFAYIIGCFFWDDLSAIVIPNDILKYNHAACSQQAIVFQELLKKKNYTVRKVGFKNSISGHFCSEVKYNKRNHFFDTNFEADWNSIDTVPSIANLVTNKNLLKGVYSHLSNDQLKVFTENKPIYGKWNVYPAKNARIFHIGTKILSNIGFLFSWIITLGLYQTQQTSHNKT